MCLVIFGAKWGLGGDQNNGPDAGYQFSTENERFWKKCYRDLRNKGGGAIASANNYSYWFKQFNNNNKHFWRDAPPTPADGKHTS